jgi:hypothetical protein
MEELDDVHVPISRYGLPTGYTSYTRLGETGTVPYTVPAKDSSGHLFKQWEPTGETTTTINIVSGGNYTAIYQAQYSLVIDTNTGGTTKYPYPRGTYSFWSGDVVGVTAEPLPQYVFDHWELDSLDNTLKVNPITVLMFANHTLRAIFTRTYDITIKTHSIIESADTNIGIWMNDQSYTTPCTFTGLAETHNVSVPSTDANGTPFKQWNTGQTSTNITVSSGGVYVAYYGTVSVHEVAITDVEPSKTIIAQNFSQSISITLALANPGDYDETFTVALYFNNATFSRLITPILVTLSNGSSKIISFTWGIPNSFSKGDYTICANITQIPGENDTIDNTYTYSIIKLTIPGDINGDSIVDISDAALVGFWWQMTVPPTTVEVDINGDEIIDISDAAIIGGNWQQHV